MPQCHLSALKFTRMPILMSSLSHWSIPLIMRCPKSPVQSQFTQQLPCCPPAQRDWDASFFCTFLLSGNPTRLPKTLSVSTELLAFLVSSQEIVQVTIALEFLQTCLVFPFSGAQPRVQVTVTPAGNMDFSVSLPHSSLKFLPRLGKRLLVMMFSFKMLSVPRVLQFFQGLLKFYWNSEERNIFSSSVFRVFSFSEARRTKSLVLWMRGRQRWCLVGRISHIPIPLVTTTESLGQGKDPLSSYLIPHCESWTSQALWGNLSPTPRNLHSVSAASVWHSSPSWQPFLLHQQWERFSEIQEEAEIVSSAAWNLSPMNFLQLWLIIGPPGGGEQGKDGSSQAFSMAS